MSTRRTQYLMLGVNLPFLEKTEKGESTEAYEDNSYKKTVNEKNGLTVVSDGMCGDYTIWERCWLGPIWTSTKMTRLAQ